MQSDENRSLRPSDASRSASGKRSVGAVEYIGLNYQQSDRLAIVVRNGLNVRRRNDSLRRRRLRALIFRHG